MKIENDIRFSKTSRGYKAILSYRIEDDVIKKMADNIESELFDRMARMRGYRRGNEIDNDSQEIDEFAKDYCNTFVSSTAAGDAITRIMAKLQSVGNDAAEPDVLGADGLPIKVGETVYLESFGRPFTVVGFDGAYLKDADGGLMRADCATHTPPDTQERIDDDATIHPYEGCGNKAIWDDDGKHPAFCPWCGGTVVNQ